MRNLHPTCALPKRTASYADAYEDDYRPPPMLRPRPYIVITCGRFASFHTQQPMQHTFKRPCLDTAITVAKRFTQYGPAAVWLEGERVWASEGE